MCNHGKKHTQKSNFVVSIVSRIPIVVLCIILFYQNTIPALCNDNNSNQSNIETSQQNAIVKIDFVIDAIPVTETELLSKLLRLTQISIGSPFSRNAVQQSVTSIYSEQTYAQIDVYTTFVPEGVILKYELAKMMHIQKVNIVGDVSDELRRVIDSSIRLKAGNKYIPYIANDDVNTIKAICADNGYFDVSVEIDTIPEKGNITYQIKIGQPTYVTEFIIIGNSSIFTEHIKEVCDLNVNQIYSKPTVNEDIRAIQELYRKKYYPSTVIKSSFKHNSGVLTYEIIEGKQLLLDFVDENGKPILNESFLRQFLSILDIETVVPERDQLREKIEQLINDRSRWVDIIRTHFEAKGYHGTQVKSRTLTNSPLHIEFTVKHGIRYFVSTLEFDGNEAFSDKELLRELESKPVNFFSRHIRKRYFSNIALERDINRLEILYEKAGYRNVEITSKIIKHNDNKQRDGEVSINLFIFEPTKEMINRCQFLGNSVLNDVTLYNALPSKPPEPNASLVQKKYENAILKAYQERGYIYAKVEKTEYLHKVDTPVFQISGDYSENLNSGILPKKLRDAFSEHSLSLSGTLTSIGSEWSIQDVDGNARYTLDQEKEHLSVYEHGVLQYDIVEGDQIIFGKFNFAGDTGVIPRVLYREVANLPGTLFTTEKLDLVVENLYNTRVFEPGIQTKFDFPTSEVNNTVNISDDDKVVEAFPEPKVNDVTIRLQKRLPRTYGASVGYSTSHGPRGTIAFSHFNLFKRNIRFHLRGRWGTRGYIYDTTLTEPWLIGRTSGSLQFLGRKLEEDDDVRALQGSFTLSRKLLGSHRLNLQYNYRYLKDTTEKVSSVIPLISNPSTTVSSLSFLWRQDNRIPSINPISGMLNEVSVEYAGGVLGGESGFIKFVSDTEYHRQLPVRGFVLSNALRFGYTPGLQLNNNDEAELISFERFWAGGSTTVRGYEERGLGPEDSTGKHRGNVQFIFNTEMRFPIYNPFHGVLFFDTGNVWDSVEDIEYKWIPSSVGMGLRLNFGPLIFGVDYAVPLITLDDVFTVPFYFRIGSTF